MKPCENGLCNSTTKDGGLCSRCESYLNARFAASLCGDECEFGEEGEED